MWACAGRKQLHQDIPQAHELTPASLEEHGNCKCVFRALAQLTGDPMAFVEAEFETIADRDGREEAWTPSEIGERILKSLPEWPEPASVAKLVF